MLLYLELASLLARVFPSGCACQICFHGSGMATQSVDLASCSASNFAVVLEKSNVAQLASIPYHAVHALPQEDCYDTDDASAREGYPFKAGHCVTSITCREGLMALPRPGQGIDLR